MRYWYVAYLRSARNKTLAKLKNNQNSVKNNTDYSILKQIDPEETDSYSSDEEVDIIQENMVTKRTYNMRQEFENSYEELVGSKNRDRKIRITLMILAALVLVGLIAIAVVLYSRTNDAKDVSPPEHSRLELEDILHGTLIAKRYNGSWISENEIIYKDGENGAIRYFDVSTNKSFVLVPHTNRLAVESVMYEKSADKKFLLIARDHSKLYRYSYLDIYEIIDLETGHVHNLTVNGEKKHLFFAKWAPVGNGIIFNYDRNLYYKPSVYKDEVQLTNDDNPAVLNGHPDWVYEEEIFGSNIAVWFNPSGTKIAYIQFDDTSTRTMNIPIYGPPGHVIYQYPNFRVIHYPKSGSQNPFVTLKQVNLIEAVNGKESERRIPVPEALNTEEHLITAVDWLDDNQILSVWMNRIQNIAYVQVSNEINRYSILEIKSKTGWVDFFASPIKNKDGSRIAFVMPHKQGNDGDYRHLTVLSTKNAAINTPMALTSGKYVIQQVLKWDYDTNIIFYTANLANQSQALHVFAIRAEKGEQPKCLTCGIKSETGLQTYFAADFNPNGNYVVLTSLGPNVPTVNIYRWVITNRDISLKIVAEWEANADLKKVLVNKSVPIIQYHTIDIDDGFTAKVLIYIPPNADLSGDTKYPMLVEVYGGPDSNAVVDKWAMDWGNYLAANRSIIYAKIDGRGSGLRGDKLAHAIYRKLGTVEVYDQVNVTRKLQRSLPYIDSEHIGIWGWSYGGYAAAMALAQDNTGVFKCATSVAPVTDWAYYDSVYTERYMDVPEKNPTGYIESRLSNLGPKFRGKNYLLVHGTLDDNVHYQQSMVLASNLEHHDIMFRQISYPDEDHGLVGVRRHLYHSLDHFFGECFGLEKSKWRRK